MHTHTRTHESFRTKVELVTGKVNLLGKSLVYCIKTLLFFGSSVIGVGLRTVFFEVNAECSVDLVKAGLTSTGGFLQC